MSTASAEVPSLKAKTDEGEFEQHCLLFPTYATKHGLDESKNPDVTDDWNIRVRGWAFSAPKTSRSRDLFIGLASRIAGISEADARYELLKTRSNLFWASNVDKEEFIVKIAGLTASDKMAIEGDSKESEEDPKKILNNVNEEIKDKIKDKIEEQHQQPDDEKPFTVFKPTTGNVNGSVSIQQAIVNEWIGKPADKEKKSLIEGVLGIFGKGQEKEKEQQRKGEKIKLLKLEARQHNSINPFVKPTYCVVNLIEPDGYSVISDIDDTIKQTEILAGARTVFTNTFLQKTKEVPGMPELYHKWYDRGVAIHYVSNSPWQLFPMLRAFFDESDFPPGSAHLKFYDGLFKSAREQKQHPMESKFVYIRELLRDFPRRKFILVGDTGEYDPEIYTTICRENPDRILRIFVRDVTTEHIKHQPAQSPYQSYAQTFTSTYQYIKDYYSSPEGKEDSDKEHEQENVEHESDEHEPNKLKRHHSLSNRLMNKLHAEMSSIYTSISSSSLPEHKHDLPSDVDIESHNKPVENQKLRTPLEMFHERLNNLKKGIPDGVFSTFVDSSELENDPIIKNALGY